MLEHKIAIVGMGGVLPGAPDLDTFWHNILTKTVSIEHAGQDTFDKEVFFRPEVRGQADTQDKSYTDLAALVKSVDFDAAHFRIPPKVARHMDSNQKVSLLCAEQAMAGGALRTVSRDRVTVVIGSSMIGELHHLFSRRFTFERFSHHLLQHEAFRAALTPEARAAVIGELRDKLLEGTIPVTEDSAPGILPNIIAARLCSVFDLHGHAYVVDAACASGLAAVICGVQQLQTGQADAVICGAVDMLNQEHGFIYFSGIGALSSDGSFPFDARANGFVIGQGGGMVILKRLSDALAAGDQINAVITGYGQASDGKGKAIAAPSEAWQAKTIHRACEMAGYPVETIGLVEAHGTATQVGDQSEVAALKNAFATLGATTRQYCGLGSVKGNIGHLKSAAGIAGFLKTTLALQHRILPPSAGFERENPRLGLADSPFFVVTEAREWTAEAHPRRAGVNAFGFGGADYHIALEEFRKEDYEGARPRTRDSATTASVSTPGAADGTATASAPAAELQAGVVFLAGDTMAEVVSRAGELAAELKEHGDALALAEHLFVHNYAQDPRKPVRLALAVDSTAHLQEQLSTVSRAAGSPEELAQATARGVHLGRGPAATREQLAFLFPGQGSQYADMGLALCRRHAAARGVLARADAEWRALAGTTVSSLLDASHRGRTETEANLKNTRNTHPALMATGLAAFAVLEQMKVVPGVMIGHSAGELVALTAAGRFTLRDGMRLMDARSRAFERVPAGHTGAMAAIAADDATTSRLLAETGLPLTVANRNSATQLIASGDEAAIDALLSVCAQRGIKGTRLNVSHAFHSPLMKPAADAFAEALRHAAIQPGGLKVIANESNQYYDEAPDGVRRQLQTQITGPVNFERSILRLYEDGVRVFAEVGPGTVLSSLTRSILEGKDVIVLASDRRGGDQVAAFNRMLCGLFAAGFSVELPAPDARPGAGASDGASARGPAAPAPAPVRAETMQPARPAATSGQRVVYSGVAVGLPGSYKATFRDDNFQQLFDGRNFIERLTDDERQRLVELRVSKLVKSEQGASFVVLQSVNEVIQLAGKIGRLDLLQDYLLDEKDVRNMSNAVALAVAAGFEALRDAHIPLVHEYTRTASGHVLPERWALPQEMQTETGVIFANGFPLCDPVIAEVSRHLSYKFGHKLRDELVEFYDTLIAKVTHDESRRLLTDWFALNYSRLRQHPSEGEVYTFNHQFMTQVASQANNRLAHLINARGPNFQLNAACSSAATAVTLAEEMIKGGRVRRMIVIGGDDPASEWSLPYLGAGFLSTGACSTESDLYEAAVPFDKRRNGMIMGAGALAIVVEADAECRRRSVIPVCELLGTHCFNTAGHHSQLDVPRYAEELERFIGRMERQHGLDRRALAGQLLYMSHEPYTPARGGCSESEAVSLRHVFGEQFASIQVSNTKGMTGHTMGASIEDATAAKALQYARIPPVVHHKVPDPTLAGLQLSTGGSHDRTYALRMAAGFGSQGNFLLLKKVADHEARISDPEVHRRWLSDISGTPAPELVARGRTLVVRDDSPGAIIATRPQLTPGCRVAVEHTPAAAQSSTHPPVTNRAVTPAGASTPAAPATPVAAATVTPPSARRAPGAPDGAVRAAVLGIIAEITGYGADILEPDMELEADLGVDTVKQATILAKLGERFGTGEHDGFRVSDFPSIRSIIAHFEGGGDGASRERGDDVVAVAVTAATATPPAAIPPVPSPSAPPAAALAAAPTGVRALVLGVIAEVTGYSPEMLAPDMELEADLGVDTVKQATIVAMLTEKLGVGHDEGFRVADYPSIAHLIAKFDETSPRSTSPSVAAPQAPTSAVRLAPSPTTSSAVAEPAPTQVAVKAQTPSVDDELARIVSELTDYPPEMLAPELTVHADLGLTTEVVERLRWRLVEAFGLDQSWSFDGDAALSAVAASIRSHRSAAPATPDDIDLARQVLTLRPAPASPTASGLAGQRVWVLGDEPAVVSAVRQAVAPSAADTAELVFAGSGVAEMLASFSHLADGPAADVIIDTTACGSAGDLASLTPQQVLATIERAADVRFAAYKLLQERARMPRRILAVTAMDGAFGVDGRGHACWSPVFGLHRGFYKALRKECPPTRVTILDVLPSPLPPVDSQLVERVLDELNSDGPGVEVCHVEGTRHQLALEDVAFDAESRGRSFAFSAEDVVVATGGGAGITSTVIRELARRAPTRFVLTGRTELTEDVARLAAMSEPEFLKEKDAIRQRLTQTGGRVTPVMIEREFAKLERAVEIHRTMEALRAAGSEVRYHAVDVRDLHRMSAVLEQVRASWGPITALIHGAGVETSRPMAQKSADEFRSVHSIKTLGAANLALLCRNDPLRLVVAFSSISGRFGNAAQIDYSAANGFLDAWAGDFQRRRGVRGLSLVWSGWAGTGMAWRNSFVRQESEAMGLNLIEPETGARAAAREICAGTGPTEVVLHRGLGGMLEPGQAIVDLSASPMLDRVERASGRLRAVHRRFGPKRDAFLDQHRFAGAPLMPGVFLMELMAEAHTLLEGGGTGAFVFRGLEFSDALRFYRDEPRDIVASIAPAALPGRYRMEVRSPFRTVIASAAELRQYSRAEVSREPADLDWLATRDWTMGDVRHVGYREMLGDAPRLALNVALGPLFNDVQRKDADLPDVDVTWNEQGICTPVRFPRAQLTEPRYPLAQSLLNPAFLDAIHQAGAVCGILLTGDVFLPAGAEEFAVVRAAKDPGQYRVIAKVQERSSDRIVYDIGMWNERGDVCAYVKGSQFRRVRQ